MSPHSSAFHCSLETKNSARTVVLIRPSPNNLPVGVAVDNRASAWAGPSHSHPICLSPERAEPYTVHGTGNHRRRRSRRRAALSVVMTKRMIVETVAQCAPVKETGERAMVHHCVESAKASQSCPASVHGVNHANTRPDLTWLHGYALAIRLYTKATGHIGKAWRPFAARSLVPAAAVRTRCKCAVRPFQGQRAPSLGSPHAAHAAVP